MDDTVTISVSSLAPEHLDALVRALTNILSSSRAEFVFAQIIDGLPVRDTVGHQPSMNKEIKKNLAPSEGAINAVKQYRETMNITSMQLEARKAQRYQDAAPGSSDFNLRLFELLAVSCHDIAALIYLTTRPGIRQDVQDPDEQAKLLDDRETNFMLAEYPNWQRYPKGVADMVGYWAEYHIFGGVMLFDRGDSGFECNGVFLHPVSGFMIFQLSATQILQLIDFITQEPNQSTPVLSPLPFKGERWERRVDPYDAMTLGIFRDKYERIIPDKRYRSHVRRAEDDPHYVDRVAFINEIYKQRDAQNDIQP